MVTVAVSTPDAPVKSVTVQMYLPESSGFAFTTNNTPLFCLELRGRSPLSFDHLISR